MAISADSQAINFVADFSSQQGRGGGPYTIVIWGGGRIIHVMYWMFYDHLSAHSLLTKLGHGGGVVRRHTEREGWHYSCHCFSYKHASDVAINTSAILHGEVNQIKYYQISIPEPRDKSAVCYHNMHFYHTYAYNQLLDLKIWEYIMYTIIQEINLKYKSIWNHSTLSYGNVCICHICSAVRSWTLSGKSSLGHTKLRCRAMGQDPRYIWLFVTLPYSDTILNLSFVVTLENMDLRHS